MGNSEHAFFLSSALLDTLIFGLVSQQYFTYWTSGYNDRMYLKFFVNVQYALVALQCILIWHLTFEIFVVFSTSDEPPPLGALWSGPVNSLCQVFIIIFANIFLATRIHGLTKSLVQSLTPMFFSIIAFVFGLVSIVATTWTPHSQQYKLGTSVVWYASQTTAECLISFFLVRVLLKSRTGMQKTDLMVKHVVRNVIQIAGLATIWAIAALVSRFWLNRITVYRVFDITSGTVYTHAIFDTLISRNQLRDRMASSSAYVDLGIPGTQSRTSRRSGQVVVSSLFAAPQSNSESEPSISGKNDIIELGKLPEGKTGGGWAV